MPLYRHMAHWTFFWITRFISIYVKASQRGQAFPPMETLSRNSTLKSTHSNSKQVKKYSTEFLCGRCCWHLTHISYIHTPFLWIPTGSTWSSFQWFFWPRDLVQQKGREKCRQITWPGARWPVTDSAGGVAPTRSLHCLPELSSGVGFWRSPVPGTVTCSGKHLTDVLLSCASLPPVMLMLPGFTSPQEYQHSHNYSRSSSERIQRNF